MHDDEIVRSVLDPNGRRVVLLERIWHGKVALVHPEMLHLTDTVMEVVAKPDHREVDPRYLRRCRYCAKDIGPSSWLVVVVSYEQAPARVITAFGRSRDPSTWNS